MHALISPDQSMLPSYTTLCVHVLVCSFIALRLLDTKRPRVCEVTLTHARTRVTKPCVCVRESLGTRTHAHTEAKVLPTITLEIMIRPYSRWVARERRKPVGAAPYSHTQRTLMLCVSKLDVWETHGCNSPTHHDQKYLHTCVWNAHTHVCR